jgi:hypothetical protein
MSFESDIEKWTDEFNKNAILVIRNSTDILFSDIIEDSPVDTGKFKRSWEKEINPEKESTCSNDLEYAEPLEFGHSDQAPQGMVRLNAQRWEQIVDKEAQQRLEPKV